MTPLKITNPIEVNNNENEVDETPDKNSKEYSIIKSNKI